jgi:ATP-binding protein involved in chromosome partitioning
MEGSDRGKPIITAEPDSMQSLAFSKVAKTVAGRISVIAAEMNAQEEEETKSDQIQPHNASHA